LPLKTVIVHHAHLCDAFASQFTGRAQHGGSRTCQTSGGAVIVAVPAGISFAPHCARLVCARRADLNEEGRRPQHAAPGTGPASTTKLSLAAGLRSGA
jgi:hypothetical protein